MMDEYGMTQEDWIELEAWYATRGEPLQGVSDFYPNPHGRCEDCGDPLHWGLSPLCSFCQDQRKREEQHERDIARLLDRGLIERCGTCGKLPLNEYMYLSLDELCRC